MAADIREVLHDIGVDLVKRGAAAGMDALSETRVAATPTGRVALDVVGALVDEYGDDAIDAIVRLIRARQKRRVDAIVDAAQARNDREAAEARERLGAKDST